MVESVLLACAGRPAAVELDDLNHDQALDLVAALEDAVQVRLGDGQGGFGPPDDHAVAAPVLVDLAVAELTGDAHADVVAVSNQGAVSVFAVDGSGGLALTAEIGIGGTAWKVATGLLDGDAIPDLVVSGDGERYLRGLGGGQFAAPAPVDVIGESAGVVVAELTGDAREDVAFAVAGQSGVILRAGDGGGAFSPSDIYGAGDGAFDLAAVDLDRGGRLDLLTADRHGGTVHVLLSTLPDAAAIAPVVPSPIGLALGPAAPNPVTRGAAVHIAVIGTPAPRWARVYDVGGRLVARIARQRDGFIWGGRGLDRRPVPAGQYVITLDAAGGSRACKVLVAR